jgi:uncharacterized protein (DUF2062 family)
MILSERRSQFTMRHPRLKRPVALLRRMLVGLLRRLVTEGITPHKLALTIALGVSIGILPLVWGSSLLCVLFAFTLGLNQASIQAANYLAYPLQIALLVPFYRLGERLFPAATAAVGACRSKGTGLAIATLKALGAWLLVAPPTAVLLYLIVFTLLTRTRFFARSAAES